MVSDARPIHYLNRVQLFYHQWYNEQAIFTLIALVGF